MVGGSSLFRLPSGCPNGIASISSRGVLNPLNRPMNAGKIPKIVQYVIDNHGRNECVLLPSHGLCVTRPWHARHMFDGLDWAGLRAGTIPAPWVPGAQTRRAA